MDDSDNDELGYVSSAVSPFETEKGDPSIDAADEKTLEVIQRKLEEEIAVYHTISGMRMFDQKKFTAEQREEMCAKYVMLVSGLNKTVLNAIKDIRSKQNGG